MTPDAFGLPRLTWRGCQIYKNTAGQKITFFAFDATTNLPKTGDAANLTAYVSKDDGSATVLGDTSASELDSTNAKGLYTFDTTQGETNADKLVFSAKSSTSNVTLVPVVIYTRPAAGSGPTPTVRRINNGSTSVSLNVFIKAADSNAGLTGLVYNSSGLVASYVRAGNSRVAITLATLSAANSSYSAGGFKEIDATNMPGLYRLDVPDAAFVSGVPEVSIELHGVANMAASVNLIEIAVVNSNLTQTLGVNETTTYQQRVQVTAAGTHSTTTLQFAVGSLSTEDNALVGQNLYTASGTTANCGVQRRITASSVSSGTCTVTFDALPASPTNADVVIIGGVTTTWISPGAITAGTIASDAFTAAKFASDVGTEFAATLIATAVDTGVSVGKALEMTTAFLAGKIDVADNGNGTRTFTIKKRDGSTTSYTLTAKTDTDNAGERIATGALS